MKAAIIAAVLGLLFMVGGFSAGMFLAPHVAVPTPPVVHAPTAPSPAYDNRPKTSAITPEALRKTSDDLFALNQTLQSKKVELDDFERKLKERSEELKEERAALDRSHKKLSGLFALLQQRLDLVEAKQMDQVQKQVDLFQSMDMPQAIDLMRAMDDPIVVRMFTLMETKPLGKLMAAWKVKYPDDTKRLLSMLADMGKVIPKDKIVLANGANSIDPGPAPADGSAPADASTAPADQTTSPADPSQNPGTPPAAAPANPDGSQPNPSNPSALASTDPGSNNAPTSDTTTPPDNSTSNPAPSTDRSAMDPSWGGPDKNAPADASTDTKKKAGNPNSPD